MTTWEYTAKWTEHGEEISPINRHKLLDLHLQTSTISYLEAGLPIHAAPYLSFVNNSDNLYEGIAKLEHQYDLDLQPNKYVVIGSDGSGNPIAINVQRNDAVEWLDHEDYFTPGYCNKSLECLLTFLIIYRDFVNDVIECNGEDAFLDCNFTNEQYDKMNQRMLMVDPIAVREQGFWKDELKMLLTNRDYYQTNP